MLALDLPETEREFGVELATRFPDKVQVVDGRAIDGTLTHWTLFVSAAGLAIAELRKIIIKLVEARIHRSAIIDGKMFQGHSADEIARILAVVNRPQDDDP